MSIFDDIGEFLSNVWHAIINLFSSDPPSGPTLPCQVPIFEAHIIGVQFMSPILVARRGGTVTGEHWTEGVDVTEPNVADGSIKPAVLLIAGRGDHRVTLRIRVTRSQNVGPTGPVRGNLGGLTLSSVAQCPTAVGDHTVAAQIDALHPAIARDAGDATWSMAVNPVGTVQLGTTRLEAVTILDQPTGFYAAGVWIEALRLLCSQAGVVGISEKRAAGAGVSRFCHASLGLVYDTVSGASHFQANPYGANGFQLGRYISPGGGKVVNCYDQAAGLSSLAGALGTRLGWKYMKPFGFLAPSDLVGVGQCNNPFYTSNGTTEMVATGAANRTAFGNHAYTAFPNAQNADIGGPDGGVAEGIGDACAGPATFGGTLTDYVNTAVDQAETRRRWKQVPQNQLDQIDAWEASQVAAINTLPNSQLEKDAMIAQVHTLAEQARQAPRNQIAGIDSANFTTFVTDGTGVTSLEFAGYAGP